MPLWLAGSSPVPSVDMIMLRKTKNPGWIQRWQLLAAEKCDGVLLITEESPGVGMFDPGWWGDHPRITGGVSPYVVPNVLYD